MKKSLFTKLLIRLALSNLKFKSLGAENISINDIEFETIKVFCEDLQLTLNLSINENFQPIKIHKINGKTAFTMVLIGFET